MEYRKDHDSLGEVDVPANSYWGAQTQRSLQNFKIGNHLMPLEIIDALACIKKASALANFELGVLPSIKKELIGVVCDEIIQGKLADQFPLSVWQTGSGTQTNMNVNEVISNRAQVINGGNLTDKSRILHPNDDVNMSQSSNDVFPAAMHIASYRVLTQETIPALQQLKKSLQKISVKYSKTVKAGRTHWMDATPITVGQEFSAFVSLIENGLIRIRQSSQRLLYTPLGGTAVGTGLNTPKGFDKLVAKHLSDITKTPFKVAKNKYELLSAHDAIVEVHSALKQIAISITKIANDIRLMASGPRCGLNEITLPANEPGSSIMPGKVNPTQIEAITMVCTQIIGNDTTIATAAMQGFFELNVYKPVIIRNMLESAKLLADSAKSFSINCLDGLLVNKQRLNFYLSQTLMLNTVLSQKLGYEKAAYIAKIAMDKNIGLKEAALSSGFIKSEDYDKWVDVNNMV